MQNVSRRVRLLPVVLALLAAVCVSAPAQSIYGSLVGVVNDSSGAAIPNAEITIRNVDTGIERKTESNSTGFWRMPSLALGKYSVSVAFKGFETVIQGPIAVEPAVERRLEVTLRPSSTNEVVQVMAEAPMIEATRAQISRGVESKRVLELPGLNSLNGLALLMPGVVNNNNGRPGSGFVVNGNRSRSNNFMLDGANNNDQSLQIPRQSVAPENLAEFRIITNQFSAEFGRNAGSVVQQITRSGTNELHGAARWSWLGNGLNALTTAQQRTFNAQKAAGRTDYQALRAARGVNVQNDVLLSAGGPIVRDKLFFYTSWDTERFRSTAVPITPTLSAAAFETLKAPANASLFAPGAVAYLERMFPVANDPTSRGNVTVTMPGNRNITLPLQQYNRGAGAALSYARNYHRGLGKMDWKATSKDDISLRLLINDNPDPGSPAPLPVNQVGQALRNYNATLNHVRMLSPVLIAENRLTYGRREAIFVENFPAQLAITGSGLPTIGNQNYPQGRTDNLYEGTSNWTWTHTKHTMRFGGNYLQYRLNSFFAPALRGVISYPSMADFLFDTRGNFSQYAGTGSVPAKTHEVGMFFGDDWRVTQSLTLNLGLRYEYTSTPFGFFSNASPDINNLAPRFGFAYSPVGGKWVMRGGYAISYDQVFQNILLNVARNYPRGVTVTQANLNGARLYDDAARPAPPQPSDYRGDPNLLPYRLFSPNKRVGQPYSQQFSFGFERQFFGGLVGKLFYVGTRGVNLIREAESNLGFFEAAIAANPSLYAGFVENMARTTVSGQAARVMDASRGSVAVGDGFGQSTYHSLQLTVDKRYGNLSLGGRSMGAAQFEANYTWSSFINDTDDILGGQANRTYPSVPFNPRLDRARSGYDQPHRFVFNYIYEFPTFFDNSRILSRVVDGWQLSGITQYFTGTPFSVLTSTNPLGILPGAVATINASQRAVYNPSGVPMTGTAATQPNPMFIAPQNNTAVIGMGANVLRVGNTMNFDTALSKNIRTFGESQSLQFRWEVSNALNRRNFSTIPSNTVSTATNNALFLNLGQTSVSGRSMVFAVRYLF